MTNTRVFICGTARSGKTLLGERIAKKLGVAHFDTDDWISKCEWGSVPLTILADIKIAKNYVLSGIQCGRVIRKIYELGLDSSMRPTRVIYLTKPFVQLNKGQITQAKGLQTIFNDCLVYLNKKNVVVEYEIPAEFDFPPAKIADDWTDSAGNDITPA